MSGGGPVGGEWGQGGGERIEVIVKMQGGAGGGGAGWM